LARQVYAHYAAPVTFKWWSKRPNQTGPVVALESGPGK
jgi:hypothetical protein